MLQNAEMKSGSRINMDIIEDIKDLPWPEEGDSIFAPSNNYKHNACFHFVHNKMNLYADGYLYAAETLIDSVISSADRVNYIDAKVYPILFLYHHHVELRLKDIISKGNSLLDKDDKFPQHHDIYELWCVAKKIICKINEHSKDKQPVNAVERVIKELVKIDRDAMGYRYPYDKEGNLLLKDINNLNLDSLCRTMKKITTFLDAVGEQIYVYLDYKQDAESNFM